MDVIEFIFKLAPIMKYKIHFKYALKMYFYNNSVFESTYMPALSSTLVSIDEWMGRW